MLFLHGGTEAMLDASQAHSALLEQLTEAERQRAVVYELADTVVRGTVLSFPQQTINIPSDALIAFIDQEPAANWGHACRYVLVELNTGRTSSWEARFPPFGVPLGSEWRVAYQAASVPEWAVVRPKPSTWQ
jgi:hypothetical protein